MEASPPLPLSGLSEIVQQAAALGGVAALGQEIVAVVEIGLSGADAIDVGDGPIAKRLDGLAQGGAKFAWPRGLCAALRKTHN